MKILIRYIARISGVERDISEETCVQAGNAMQWYSHWFSGNNTDIANAYWGYASQCLKKGQPCLTGIAHDKLREELLVLSDLNRLSVKSYTDYCQSEVEGKDRCKQICEHCEKMFNKINRHGRKTGNKEIN